MHLRFTPRSFYIRFHIMHESTTFERHPEKEVYLGQQGVLLGWVRGEPDALPA